MRTEGRHESSGQFTVAEKDSAARYSRLLAMYPSWPWTLLNQGAVARRCQRIDLKLRSNLVEWRAVGLQSDGDWTRRLRGPDRLIQALQSCGPKSIYISWSSGAEGWQWSWPEPASLQVRPGEAFPAGEMQVSLRVSLSSRQRRALQQDWLARSLFCPIPLSLNGRLQGRSFDLTSRPSRAFGVAVYTTREDEFLPLVEPREHRPVLQMRDGEIFRRGSSGAIACYHLHGEGTFGYPFGPELPRSGNFLARLLGNVHMQQCMRGHSVFLLSGRPERGPISLVGVRHGVCLDPVVVEGPRRGSTIITLCPAELRTDLSGLKLIEDEPFQAWVREMLERASRCI